MANANVSAMTTSDPVLAQTGGGRFKGKLRMFFGRFELTGRELVFYQRSIWFQMFGLIGALLGRKSAGKRTIALELGQVRSLARGKFGLNKKILDVTMADGSAHRFAFDDYDDFTSHLRAQVGTHLRLVDAGDERWQAAS